MTNKYLEKLAEMQEDKKDGHKLQTAAAGGAAGTIAGRLGGRLWRKIPYVGGLVRPGELGLVGAATGANVG